MNKQKQKMMAWLWLIAGVLVLSGCGVRLSNQVSPESEVTISYQATSPFHAEVLTSGIETIKYNPSTAELFALLADAKKGESRTEILQDPFHKHNPQLVEKMPTLVLREMGIELELSQTDFELNGMRYTITDILTEEGIEKAVLDANDPSSVLALEWKFEVIEIR